MWPEYTVQEGDSLSGIAEELLGDSSLYERLGRFNNLKDYEKIEIGTVLQIPLGFYDVHEKRLERNIATHIVRHKSTNQDTAESLDGLMVFCPMYVGTGRAAFMYIPPEDAEDFVAQMDALDMDRKDFAHAYKKAREIRAPEERQKALEEVEKRFKDQYVSTLKPGEAKPDFQELIILNKWKPKKLTETYRYIKGDKVQKKWVAETAEELEKRIRSESRETLDGKKQLSDYVTAKVKANLWKMKKPPEGQIFPEWRFSSEKDAWKNNKHVAASYDVAFLRYAANAEVGAEFDLKEGVVQVNACGSASFSLVEGKADIELCLPDKEGFDLFAVIKGIVGDKHFKKDRQCFLKLSIKGEVYGFVGAQAALSLPKIELDLKGEDASIETFRDGEVEKQKVVAELSASAFAGASGTLAATYEAQWKNVFNKNAWGSLAKQGGALSGRAGIGGEAGVKFDFQGGKIVFSARAQLVVGLGGKAELIYELDLNEGCQLIGHFMESVAYHNLYEITPDCFAAFYKFHLYVMTKSYTLLANLGKGIINSIGDWWAEDRVQSKQPTIHQLNPKELRQAPPETLGRLIHLAINPIQPPVQRDYERVLEMMEQSRLGLIPGQRNHELRWIVRFISTESTEQIKSKKVSALKNGIDRLTEFFENAESRAIESQLKRLDSLVEEARK